jgi:hypothetical protein
VRKDETSRLTSSAEHEEWKVFGEMRLIRLKKKLFRRKTRGKVEPRRERTEEHVFLSRVSVE